MDLPNKFRFFSPTFFFDFCNFPHNGKGKGNQQHQEAHCEEKPEVTSKRIIPDLKNLKDW